MYGSWEYDESADIIVALYSRDPKAAFSGGDKKSLTLLCDLATNEWKEVEPKKAVPYNGMSFNFAYDPRHKITFYVERNAQVWTFKAPKK